MQLNSNLVGPAVFLSGPLKFLGAGPTGPLEKNTKIRAEHLVIQSYPEGKLLFTTVNNQVLCNRNVCMNECDHEEADTRMLLHLKDCLSSGLKDICIISPDTDVLVI